MMGNKDSPNLSSETMETEQGHFQDQFSGHYTVVESRITPGKEHSLEWQVPVLYILLHNLVAIEQVLHVLNERNHADTLWEELPHPVLNRLAVEQHMVFLADDHLFGNRPQPGKVLQPRL